MKKILSLALTGVMMFSALPMAYATNVYPNPDANTEMGTMVEYKAASSSTYTVTVPALLTPGQGGTVTLKGTWPSNETISVTADETVTLINSINANDNYTLDIEFAGIEKAGDNTAERTYTETVSVSEMPVNVLFGTWNGIFYYNVETNEYTPYAVRYGQIYDSTDISITPDEIFNMQATSFIFHEDGSLTGYSYCWNGTLSNNIHNPFFMESSTLPVGTVKFDGANLIDPTSGEIMGVVSEDGKQIFVDGMTLNLAASQTYQSSAYYRQNSETGEYELLTSLPNDAQFNDLYFYGDYVYRYWGTVLEDDEVYVEWSVDLALATYAILCGHETYITPFEESYGPILESVNGRPVTALMDTFAGAFNLANAPDIPKTVTFLTCTFTGCESITSIGGVGSGASIELGDSLTMGIGPRYTSIGVFSQCTNLTDCVIPEGTKAIGARAFTDCTNLTNLTLPSSIEKIDGLAFCPSLTNIVFEGTVDEWNSIVFVDGWNYRTPATHVQCSDGSVALS